MANPYGKINQTINQPINSQLTKQTTIQSLTLLIQLFLTIILWVLIIVFSAQYTSVSVLKINQIKRISISAHCLPFRLDWLVKEWARVSTSEIEREKERERQRERQRVHVCVCVCVCVWKSLVMKPTWDRYNGYITTKEEKNRKWNLVKWFSSIPRLSFVYRSSLTYNWRE